MPTLGFLKKKRTKDSNGSRDLDSPTSPIKETHSPITPTTSKTSGSFHFGHTKSNATTTTQDSTVASSQSTALSQSQSQPQSQSQANHKAADSMMPQQAYATPQSSPGLMKLLYL